MKLNEPMDKLKLLDEQYLEFCKNTEHIYTKFPQIEPLRFFIFKEILIHGIKEKYLDVLKFHLRSLMPYPKTVFNLKPAKVLIWMESSRDTIKEILIPVYEELIQQKITTNIVGLNGDNTMPSETIYFKYGRNILPPKWAKLAWNEFIKVLPAIDNNLLKRIFINNCIKLQGRFIETDRILDIIQPKVLLNASMRMLGGVAAIINAKKKQVTTIELQHGITEIFYTPIVTDYIITWGQTSYDNLASMNVPENKIIPLGSPRHDLFKSSNNNNKRLNLLKTLILSDRPTFVFFSNGNDLYRNGKAPIECVSWLEKTAERFKNEINVVVRLHPNEDGSLYDDCTHLHITKNEVDITTMLEGCDWIGSLCSSVLYEALLFRKPVWQFKADHWPDLADNWRRGLALRVSSQSDLDSKVNSLLNNGFTNNNTGKTRSVFINHGHSSKEIVDFIKANLEMH